MAELRRPRRILGKRADPTGIGIAEGLSVVLTPLYDKIISWRFRRQSSRRNFFCARHGI